MPLPEDVQAHELDRDARKELMALAKDTADTVARHLVMAGRLIDDDPTAALAHARAARALAGRVAVVREANGLVAYAAGEWAEALTELRTARRVSGDPSHLPVMADCERALGRPERALLVVDDPQAGGLDAAARVELLIVASGARRDLGQPEAAAASLQVGALEGPVKPWTARLRYAYADALVDSGREDDARQWFARAAEVDPDGETDAVDRLLALDGIVLDEGHVDDPGLGDGGLDAPGPDDPRPDDPLGHRDHALGDRGLGDPVFGDPALRYRPTEPADPAAAVTGVSATPGTGWPPAGGQVSSWLPTEPEEAAAADKQ